MCLQLIQAQGMEGRAGASSAQAPDIQVQGRTWARLMASEIDTRQVEDTEQVV